MADSSSGARNEWMNLEHLAMPEGEVTLKENWDCVKRIQEPTWLDSHQPKMGNSSINYKTTMDLNLSNIFNEFIVILKKEKKSSMVFFEG